MDSFSCLTKLDRIGDLHCVGKKGQIIFLIIDIPAFAVALTVFVIHVVIL